MIRLRRYTIPLAALAVFAWAALNGCGSGRSSSQAAEAETTAVARLSSADVATVARQDLAAGIPVSGTLEPGRDVKLTAPLDDVVREVRVREGAKVAKGQVIARFRLEAVETDAASARAQLDMAAADYERQKNLLAEGAVSKRDAEAAEAAWRAARATHAAASRRLDDAVVRAPFAGVVAERSVEAGDRVSSGDPMFRVVDTSTLEFEAAVPAEYATQVEAGAPVHLTVTGYDGTLEGRISRVNAAADPATRQVKVYVQVPNPGRKLVSGLFASGSVVTRRAASALAVPAGALREDGQGTHVLLVENGTLARRPVRPGLRDAALDRVEILQGLAGGETVVTTPLEGLVPGRRVLVEGKGR